MDVALRQVAGHVMNAKPPVTEIDQVVQEVIDHHQYQHAEAPIPEGIPGILVRHRAHVIEVVMPGQEWNEGKAGNFGGVIP